MASAERTRLVVIVAVTAAARLLYLAATVPPEPANYYWRVATGLLTEGRLADAGVATAAFEPGYPAFLALARLASADHAVLVLACQIGVAALGAALLYHLTLRLSGRPFAAAIAALEFALYPYLIRQSVAFIEVTLLSTLVIASTQAFVRIRDLPSAAACGGLLALGVLTRAAIAPLAALWAGTLWLRGRRSAAAWMIVAAVVPVLPLSVLLHRYDGSFVPTRDGENLFVGNCEYSDRFIPAYDVDFLVEHGVDVAARAIGVAPGEASRGALDDEMRRQALAFIRAHPWRTLKLKVMNVAYLFQPRIVPYVPWGPSSSVTFLPDGNFRIERPRERDRRAELAHGLVHTFVLVTGLIGLVRRRRDWRQDLPLWMALLTVTAGAVVYFPSTRIAAPVMFVWMFYSGCALATLREKTAA